eukprot:COSAG04_NODE_7632_length_1094_cov_1.238191_3_plen_107_part_00
MAAEPPAGWLTKQGKFRTAWRRRWFAWDASGDRLRYFESPQPASGCVEEPRGSIEAAEILEVVCDADGSASFGWHALEVAVPGRRYLLRADTVRSAALALLLAVRS